MLRVSRLTDYATGVMTCLAARTDAVLNAAQVAEATRLELPTVSKLLKRLTRAGLIESFRGASGGYRLARAAQAISIAAIVEAVEGPLGMTDCSAGSRCERERHCSVRGNWLRISDIVAAALRGITLADLQRPIGVPRGRALPVRVVLTEDLR